LIFAAAEDADLDAGLEEQVEERGDGADHGFAAAAAGPDDGVGFGCGFEEGVLEVIERGVVAGADGGFGEVDGGECLDPFPEVAAGFGGREAEELEGGVV